MSKIARYAGNLKAFGSDAQGLERTLFGETKQADDLTSQVTAAFLRGWGVVGPSEHPSLEDFNAAMYAMSQFIAYQHQMGVPEWDAAQEYYIGSLCVYSGETYSSLVNSNIGSAPPSAKWTKLITVKNGVSSLGPRSMTATASGSFAVPLGVTTLYLSGCAGGGGGGGGGGASNTNIGGGGGGGGAGQSAIKRAVAVVPGQSYAYTIGSGGAGGLAGTSGGANGGDGGAGGVTTFGSLLTLSGGSGGAGGIKSTSGQVGGGAGGAGYPYGNSGSDSSADNASGNGGTGASGPFGGGGGLGKSGKAATGGNSAYAASGYGCGGGGGGGVYTTGVATGGAGGAGSPGILIVEW